MGIYASPFIHPWWMHFIVITFSLSGNFQVSSKGRKELKEKAMKSLKEIILVANSEEDWSDTEPLPRRYRVLSLRTWELYKSAKDFQH